MTSTPGRSAVGTLTWRSLLCVLCAQSYTLCESNCSGLQYQPPSQLCILENKRITESSGLAASRRTDGYFWTHNDSGDKPRLYCFDRTGRHVGTCKLSRAGAIDWEDLCSFELDGRARILVGDIGDNAAVRKSCRLYLIDEPKKPSDDTKDVQVIVLRYSIGPVDCEAMGVDVATRKILLVEKRLGVTCRVFEADFPDSHTKSITATPIGVIDLPIVTAMDISPDGCRAIVLTLGQAFEFIRQEHEDWQDAFGKPPRTIDMPARKQGEAICYGTNGRDLYLTSEQRPTPFFVVPAKSVSGITLDRGKR